MHHCLTSVPTMAELDTKPVLPSAPPPVDEDKLLKASL